MRIRPIAVMLVALYAAPVQAEVVQATSAGFEVRQTMSVDAPIDRVWTTVTVPARWWSKDHTYSDDPANLSLEPRPGGCFCEKLPNGGGVEHLHVVYAQPPQMIRMTGALGPLQAEAADGTLAIVLKADGAKATTVTMTYVAGGYVRAGADTLAPKVDEVLALEMVGLKSAAEAAPAGR